MIDEMDEMKKKMSAFMSVFIAEVYNDIVFLSKLFY